MRKSWRGRGGERRVNVDIEGLVKEGEKLWEQVKDAKYSDFWGTEGFGGSPTELLQRCWSFTDKVKELENDLRERAKREGLKERRGAVIAVKVGEIDEYDDDGRCFTKPIFRYLPVSERFLQCYNKLMELKDRIEWKVTENRFIE